MADDGPRRSNWNVATEPVGVQVGSQVRLSVALLRELYDRPWHESEVVEVERLIREPDGTITIWLTRPNTLRQ